MARQILAKTEPEKFIQIEKILAGSAVMALPNKPSAKAEARPLFCMPTSIAIVLASISFSFVMGEDKRVIQ